MTSLKSDLMNEIMVLLNQLDDKIATLQSQLRIDRENSAPNDDDWEIVCHNFLAQKKNVLDTSNK